MLVLVCAQCFSTLLLLHSSIPLSLDTFAVAYPGQCSAVLSLGVGVMMILTLLGIKYGTTSRPLEWHTNVVGIIVVLLWLVLCVSFVFVVTRWHATVSARTEGPQCIVGVHPQLAGPA